MLIPDSNSKDNVDTPGHIAGLMVNIVNPRPEDVILDITCGIGNLLAACKQGQRVGTELDARRYEQCVQNLGDEAHIYLGDCFEYEDVIRQHKPTIGLLNPPYTNAQVHIEQPML